MDLSPSGGTGFPGTFCIARLTVGTVGAARWFEAVASDGIDGA